MTCVWAVLVLPVAGAAQSVSGVVRSRASGHAIPAVEVSVAGNNVLTDSAGIFVVGATKSGSVSISFRRLGFASLDTILEVGAGGHVVLLEELPVELQGLTIIGSRRNQVGLDAWRPGLMEFRSDNLTAVPDLAEADLLRVLQVAPGVGASNELNVELHVRGGASDQTPVLLNGARIFAPFHILGLIGAVNPDAVRSIRLDRAYPPIGYVGATSGTVQFVPDFGPDSSWGGTAALGLISARGSVGWRTGESGPRGRFSVRRSHLNALSALIGEESGSKFDFSDLNLSVEWPVSRWVTARFAGLHSQDDMLGAFGGDESLSSGWRNRVAALTVSSATHGWRLDGTSGYSDYEGHVTLGNPSGSMTESRARSAYAAVETLGFIGETQIRVGARFESQVGEIGGGGTGGLVAGNRERRLQLLLPYAEVSHSLTERIQLDAGVQAPRLDGAWYLEPRARLLLHSLPLIEDVALTFHSARQALSTLTDDRYVLPGPPMWYAHGARPTHRQTISVTVRSDAWHGWRAEASLYAGELDDVVGWQPIGERSLDQVRFETGTARGLETLVEHHGDQWDVLLAYTLSGVELSDGETERRPPWDQTHVLSALASRRFGESALASVRMEYGSGRPLHPIVGGAWRVTTAPYTGSIGITEVAPIFASTQITTEPFFRADLGTHFLWTWFDHEFGLSAGVLNVTGRENVLYYDVRATGLPGEPQHLTLVPVTASVIRVFPNLEFSVRF